MEMNGNAKISVTVIMLLAGAVAFCGGWSMCGTKANAELTRWEMEIVEIREQDERIASNKVALTANEKKLLKIYEKNLPDYAYVFENIE